MATLTPGNRLWFYQLFSEKIGLSKQVPLSAVEEVISAEGVAMEDVGCADARELMEALAPFAKLTVFKKGRTYVTVVPQPEWDAILARAKEAKPAQPATGAKSWKHKKSSKDPQPAKPKPRRKKGKKPAEGETEHAGETAGQVAEADGQAAASPQEPEADMAAPATHKQVEHEPSSAEVTAPTLAADLEPTTAPSTVAAPTAQAEPSSAADQAARLSPAPPAEEVPQPEPTVPVAPEPAAPAGPEPAGQAEGRPDAPEPAPQSAPEAPKPEPSIHFTITYDPYEGLDDEMAAEAEATAPAADGSAAAPAPGNLAATAGPAPADKGKPARPQAGSQPAPAPAEPAVPAVVRHPEPVSPVTLQADLPQSLSAEAHMKDEVLRLLWDLMPLGTDVAAVLDEDWRVARSTGRLAGTRSRVTFPLRYLHEDGASHVEVTLRRTARPVAGKRWSVAFVDGRDSVDVDAAASPEGLAAEHEGAWQLLGGRDRATTVSSQRELEQAIVIGSWDSLLECLASVAAPEDWGEGRSILRELTCVTFHRIMREGKLAVADDRSAAAFDTGLMTPVQQDVCALLAPHAGDIPWELAGFYPADAPELAAVGKVPQPAGFMASLADVTLPTGASVRLSPQVEEALGEEAAWHLDHALRLVRHSYRLVAPAYDPETEAICLLVPLAVRTAAHADKALALSPDGQAGWVGTALLTLDEARACARPLCAEMPSWLAR